MRDMRVVPPSSPIEVQLAEVRELHGLREHGRVVRHLDHRHPIKRQVDNARHRGEDARHFAGRDIVARPIIQVECRNQMEGRVHLADCVTSQSYKR